MDLLAAALAITLSAAAALAYIRSASSGRETPRSMAVVAGVASLAVSFTTLWLAWVLLTWIAPQGGWFEPSYGGMAAAGALLGATIYIAVRLIFAELTTSLLQWSWVEDLRTQRDLPKFRIRIQSGSFKNAFAIGGLGAHLVVLGDGLVQALSPAHLRGVVAHEIAHVARRDVPRLLLPLVVVGGTLHAISVVKLSHPLFATHELWGIASGAVLAGLFAGLFVVLLPGFLMRRMEFGADRVAAEMLGDGELLAQALERLAEITGQPLDQWSWSHPPLQARIAALRSPAA